MAYPDFDQSGLPPQLRDRLGRIAREGAPVNAAAATLSTAFDGANNDITVTALTRGTAGNAYSLTVVAPTTDATLAATIVGSDITVTLGFSNATLDSTAADVIAAMAAVTAIAAAVTITNKGADTGEGKILTAMDKTSLAGGVNCTPGKQWDAYVDASYLYVNTANTAATSQTWRRVSLGSAY